MPLEKLTYNSTAFPLSIVMISFLKKSIVSSTETNHIVFSNVCICLNPIFEHLSNFPQCEIELSYL